MEKTITTWLSANTLPIIVIVIAAYLVDRFGLLTVRVIIRRTVGRLHNDSSPRDVRKRQDTLISMFSAVVRVLVWLVAIFSILRRFGIDLTPLLAGASVLGVALGFGAQSIIKDFLSGLFIILENQYRVGDTVEINSANGLVEQITIRSTTIRDADGNVHYIPNGGITDVTNKTMGFSKVNLSLGVAPDTNIDAIANLINEVGSRMSQDEKWKSKILEPLRFKSVGTFSNTSIEIKITGKTQPSEQWNVTDELRRRLLSAFKKHGITLAQPPTVSAGGPKK